MKNLSMSDIKIGMTVSNRQLFDIKNIYIILANVKTVLDDSEIGYHLEGTIVFIGKKQDSDYEKAWESNDNIMIVHNEDECSDDIEDGDYVGQFLSID